MTFALTSPAFSDYELLPDGALRTSPPLAWTEPPAGTRSLALIVEKRPKLHAPWDKTLESDPETYWLAWGLPPKAGKVDRGASLVREGTSTSREIGWSLPPIEKGARRVIVFRLLALSGEVELPRGASRMELLQACAGLVLAEADLEAIEEPGRPRIFERLGRLLP